MQKRLNLMSNLCNISLNIKTIYRAKTHHRLLAPLTAWFYSKILLLRFWNISHCIVLYDFQAVNGLQWKSQWEIRINAVCQPSSAERYLTLFQTTVTWQCSNSRLLFGDVERSHCPVQNLGILGSLSWGLMLIMGFESGC